MKILLTICGRGGSKGIPGKNIRSLNQRPLLSYTIDHAKWFSHTFHGDIGLSTDSSEIKKVAEEHGVFSNYERPSELSSDVAGKIDTIRHLLEYEEKKNDVKYDFILDLDISSPMRTKEDLLGAFEIIEENKDAYNLFSVNNAVKNPYFNMVENGGNGFYRISKQVVGGVLARQNAPKVYELNASFYFYRRIFFNHDFKSPITDRSLIYLMPHLCFDLDNIIDFEFLEFLLIHNKLGFRI